MTAIVTIPSGDRTLLRADLHTIDDGAPLVYGLAWVTVASAEVSEDNPDTYPRTEYIVENTTDWDAVQVGQAFRILDDEDVPLLYGVVRKLPTDTKFYGDVRSLGDAGYARQIQQPVPAGAVIQVAKHRPIWSLYSSIRSGVFFKQYDLPYLNQGANPPPIVNLGENRIIQLDDDGDSAEFNFAAAVTTWGGKTIVSYAWDLGGGAGSPLDEDSATGTFNPGWYIVTCTVTDSGGASMTAFRYVVVGSPGFPLWNTSHRAKALSDRQDRAGRDLELQLSGNFDDDTLYPGQPVLMYEAARFNGSALSSDVHRVAHYIGYIEERDITYAQATSGVVRVKSLMSVFKNKGAAPQLMTEASLPTDWTQVTSALSNPVGAVWYVLQYHAPNAIAGHDYHFAEDLTLLRRQSFGISSNTLWGQLDGIAKMIAGGNIGCRSDGTIVLAQRAQFMLEDDRDALVSRFSYQPGDIIPPVKFALRWGGQVGAVNGYGIMFNGEAIAVASLAPGRVRAQGGGTSNLSCIVQGPAEADAQTWIEHYTGQQFAFENNPLPNVSIKLDRNLDICEPCDVDVWHTFSPGAYDEVNILRETARVLPVRVTRNWQVANGALTKTIQVEFEPETFGQPGIFVAIERGEAEFYLEQGWNLQTPVPFDPKDMVESMFIIWNSAGKLARTFDGLNNLQRWTDETGSMSGTVECFAFDYASDLIQSEFETGTLGGWAVTRHGNFLRIYYCADLLADDLTWTQDAFYENTDLMDTPFTVVTSKTHDLAGVAWREDNRVAVVRWNGTAWSASPTAVGDTDTNTNDEAFDVGFVLNGQDFFVTARTSAEWDIFTANGATGSFSQVANEPSASDTPAPWLAHDGVDTLYATYIEDPTTDAPGEQAITPSGGTFNIFITQPRQGELPSNVTFGSKQDYMFSWFTDYVVANEAEQRSTSGDGWRVRLRAGTGPKNAIVSPGPPSGQSGSGAFPNPGLEGADWGYGGTGDLLRLQSHFARGYNYLGNLGNLAHIEQAGAFQRWVLDLEFFPQANLRPTYDMDEFEWTVRMDFSQSPEEFDTPIVDDLDWFTDPDNNTMAAALNQAMETFAELLDASGEVLWASPVTQFDVFENDGNLGRTLVTSGMTVLEVFFAYQRTFNYALSPEIEGVVSARVVFRHQVGEAWGDGINDVVTGIDTRYRAEMKIFTVSFFPTSSTIPTQRKVFKISDPNGSPSWSDITPADDYAPLTRYAGSTDPEDADYLVVVGTGDANTRVADTVNGGSSWAVNYQETTPYESVKTAGGIFIWWGDSRLDMVISGGRRSLIGNLESAIGTVGTIKGVAVLL